jgi:hypothetical protein
MPDELRSSVRVTLAALVLLTLLIGGLWGDGHLGTRAAHGALAGLGLAAAVLTTAYLAHRRVGGVPDA